MIGPRARIADYLRRRLRVPTMASGLRRLARNGLHPARAYDVGAYRGDFTANLLLVWPRIEVVCFEPLPGKIDVVRKRFATNPRVHGHDVVLGRASGETVSLALAETASSVLREHIDQPFLRIARETASIDDLLVRGLLPGPADLIKIDVQGYELSVLQGAQSTLEHASALVVEANLLDVHRGVPLLHEVIAWLATRGFVAYDIAGLTRRPLDDALWQIDAVFVREDGALRADKRWSA